MICCFLVAFTFPLPLVLDAGQNPGSQPSRDLTRGGEGPRTPIHLTPPIITDFPPPVNDTVRIRDGQLFIRGRETYLYGGELQYFRVRDEHYDANGTWTMWEETLAMMRDAGMNFVSFYIPWDYHEIDEGEFDFEGAKDLDRLLSMCYEMDFHVMVRPGPYIIAEWPNGPGSFGAVPQWFKDDHPETLQGKPDGSLHDQPTYLHPTFLEYTNRWFAELAPLLRKYIHDKPCIAMVQLDNEPNFLWVDHFTVDYSDTMITYYRDYLLRKYGDISVLNQDYHTGYGSFSEVDPPESAPTESHENPAAWDWFDAAQCYIIEYLLELRTMWEELGIRERDIMFVTNDGTSDIPTRNILMWDGLKKNIPGLSTLDIYAKMWPTNGHIMDIPFSADYFVKLYEYYADEVRGAGGYSMGPEIQGGWWIDPPYIRPEETEMLLAKLIGHGLDGIGIYVIQGGFNMDGSVYDFQAPIDTEGNARDRFDVLDTYGKRLLEPYGTTLMASDDVESPVAVAGYWPYMNPQGGIQENMEYFYAYESAALLGMLITAGYNPDVIDICAEDKANLSDYRALFFLNPGFIRPEDAVKLRDYVAGGGNLVQFLWPGAMDMSWENNSRNEQVIDDLFPAAFLEQWDWWYPPFGDHLDFDIGGRTGRVWGYNYQTSWDLAGCPDCVPFLRDRSDNVVGYHKSHGAGCAYLIGTYLSTNFNNDQYYSMGEDDIAAKSELVTAIMDRCGVPKIICGDGPFHEVWARKPRKLDGELFVFAVNSREENSEIGINFDNLSAIGLYPDIHYRVERILAGEPLGQYTGRELLEGGLGLSMTGYSAEVVRIAAEHEIRLDEGWNLISVPTEVRGRPVHEVLAGLDGRYDLAEVYEASSPEDPWKIHHAYRDDRFNDEFAVNCTNGLWVHITEEGGATLSFTGGTAATPRTVLEKGWNLIGYPFPVPSMADEVLESIEWTGMRKFPGGSPNELEEMTGDELMQPCNAYWLKVDEPCILEFTIPKE